MSGPQDLFEAADRRMARGMITNFSEYVRALIRKDVSGELPTLPAPKTTETPDKEAA